MTVRTRFAPSPTGYLHIGGVRTALFNWLFARGSTAGSSSCGSTTPTPSGTWREALQPILDGFQWLGIDWDEGPTDDGGSRTPCGSYFPVAAARPLPDGRGRAAGPRLRLSRLRTPEELKAERDAAQREKRSFVYSRRWMAETPEQPGPAIRGRGAVAGRAAEDAPRGETA
jgi:glutamyl-tRNA synthetase